MTAVIKSIGITRRRPGFSRAEFQRYYEDHHVALGLAWFAFDKYVRNHVADDTPDPGFDCVAEFWPRDLAQIERAFTAAATLFEKDDAEFIGVGRRGGRVEEHHLAGPPREVDPPGIRKRIDLLRVSTLPTLRELAAWARSEVVAGRADRISVDLPIEGLGDLGDVALLHRWSATSDIAPPGDRLTTAVAEVCETPGEALSIGPNAHSLGE